MVAERSQHSVKRPTRIGGAGGNNPFQRFARQGLVDGRPSFFRSEAELMVDDDAGGGIADLLERWDDIKRHRRCFSVRPHLPVDGMESRRRCKMAEHESSVASERYTASRSNRATCLTIARPRDGRNLERDWSHSSRPASCAWQ